MNILSVLATQQMRDFGPKHRRNGDFKQALRQLLLMAVAILPPAAAQPTGQSWQIHGLPENWQAVLTLQDCDHETCQGEGSLYLHRGPQSQTLFIPAYAQTRPPRRLEYADSNLVMADFNFDGLLDIAIGNGSHGRYHSPSYDVYLQTTDGLWVWHADLSELTLTSMGLFQLDARQRRIHTFTRNGCCLHLHEEWAWLPEGRLHKVRYIARDTTHPDTVEITEAWRENDRWHYIVRHENPHHSPD